MKGAYRRGMKGKNYSTLEFKENLKRYFAGLSNSELFEQTLLLLKEVGETGFETAKLEAEIASQEFRNRLKDWLKD